MGAVKFNLEQFKPKTIIKKKFNSSLLSFSCPSCNNPLVIMSFFGAFNDKFCYVALCEKDNEYYFTIAEDNSQEKASLLTETTNSAISKSFAK